MIKPRHIVKNINHDYRLIAISDIHGHLDEFKELLYKVNYTSEDYLVIIGDFVEKGDQVIDTIHYIQELSKNERVYVLLGNCEWALDAMLTIEELASQIPLYLKRVPLNGCIRELYKRLKLYDGHETTLGVQKVLREELSSELKYIQELPVTLKFNDFLFVHAGLEPRKNYKECGLSSMLELQHFSDIGHMLEETVIVGHLPTSNYRKIINNDVYYDNKHRIISIDGGMGVKRVCQLNALIIESKDGNVDIHDTKVMPFKERKTIKIQEGKLNNHKVAYPDYQIEIITKDKQFSYCKYKNQYFNIKNEFIYKKNNNYYCLDDYTDNFLTVSINDTVKIIDTYDKYVYAYKDGIVGWISIDCVKWLKKY